MTCWKGTAPRSVDSFPAVLCSANLARRGITARPYLLHKLVTAARPAVLDLRTGPAIDVRSGNDQPHDHLGRRERTDGRVGPGLLFCQTDLSNSRQIDGIFGPETKAAMKYFQLISNLTVDGVVGLATWAELGGNSPQPPTLTVGARGPVVGKLQTALNQAGPLRTGLRACAGGRQRLRPDDRGCGPGSTAARRHPRGRPGRPPDLEAYAKLSLKKYRPMAARNEDKKVFSGLL